MREIRQAALEELARNANLSAIEKDGKKAMIRALNQFTRTQQDILFPNGLVSDIRKIGETIDFVFAHKPDVGMAGMHAGAVLEKPLAQRLYRQAIASITRMVVLHPSIARWIVTGRDPNTPWIQNSARTIENMVKLSALTTHNPAPPPQPQPMPGAPPQ